jgi:hypothetical protein
MCQDYAEHAIHIYYYPTTSNWHYWLTTCYRIYFEQCVFQSKNSLLFETFRSTIMFRKAVPIFSQFTSSHDCKHINTFTLVFLNSLKELCSSQYYWLSIIQAIGNVTFQYEHQVLRIKKNLIFFCPHCSWQMQNIWWVHSFVLCTI